MRSLVIGGTGPTGPLVVQGLRERGYRVTILHRGTHEVELPSDVEHIHGDAHFAETLAEALGPRTFDLVLAMYGRLRYVAEVMRGRTPRLIGLGGVAVYRGWFHPDQDGNSLPFPIPEDAPLQTNPQVDTFSYLMVQSEQAVMAGHREGHYQATVLRFPMVYGPRQLIPAEWSILRRILDGRKQVIVPEGGLVLETRGYAENMAHGILLCVDHPQESAGQVYNIGDEQVFSLADWIALITRIMGHRWEMVAMPALLARPAGPYGLWARTSVFQLGQLHHRVMDLTKLKTQLGYRDVVPAPEGLRRTVEWYLQHPPERGGEIEQRLQDPFDYEAEDRLIFAYQSSLEPLLKLTRGERWRHPYPHPKKPGLLRDEAGR